MFEHMSKTSKIELKHSFEKCAFRCFMLHNCITNIMLLENVRDKDPAFFCLTEVLTNTGNEHDLVSNQHRHLVISKNTL